MFAFCFARINIFAPHRWAKEKKVRAGVGCACEKSRAFSLIPNNKFGAGDILWKNHLWQKSDSDKIAIHPSSLANATITSKQFISASSALVARISNPVRYSAATCCVLHSFTVKRNEIERIIILFLFFFIFAGAACADCWFVYALCGMNRTGVINSVAN